MTKQTTFTKTITNSAGNLRTVYVRIADRFEGCHYLSSFEGGEWKRSEELVERHRLRRSYRLLSDAKDSVKVSERMIGR